MLRRLTSAGSVVIALLVLAASASAAPQSFRASASGGGKRAEIVLLRSAAGSLKLVSVTGCVGAAARTAVFDRALKGGKFSMSRRAARGGVIEVSGVYRRARVRGRVVVRGACTMAGHFDVSFAAPSEPTPPPAPPKVPSSADDWNRTDLWCSVAEPCVRDQVLPYDCPATGSEDCSTPRCFRAGELDGFYRELMLDGRDGLAQAFLARDAFGMAVAKVEIDIGMSGQLQSTLNKLIYCGGDHYFSASKKLPHGVNLSILGPRGDIGKVTTLLGSALKSYGTNAMAPAEMSVDTPEGSVTIAPTAGGGIDVQIDWRAG